MAHSCNMVTVITTGGLTVWILSIPHVYTMITVILSPLYFIYCISCLTIVSVMCRLLVWLLHKQCIKWYTHLSKSWPNSCKPIYFWYASAIFFVGMYYMYIIPHKPLWKFNWLLFGALVFLVFVLLEGFFSYHIISYHIISYHIISYHIISHHIIRDKNLNLSHQKQNS